MTSLLAGSLDGKKTDAECVVVAEASMTTYEDMKNVLSEEEAMSWLMADLAMFALVQGADRAGIDNPDQVVVEAQRVWTVIIAYLKDTHDIDMHALGMLTTIAGIITEYIEDPNDPLKESYSILLKSILNYINTLMNTVPKEFKPVDYVPVPEIDECTDANFLTKEFFRCMIEIGTFHRDREQYETEEQLKLHDRILAIYSRLGTLVK